MAVRTKEGRHSFLPGGHVETGESLPVALVREMLEETGRSCEVKEYLGMVENTWMRDGVRIWEHIHLFHASIPDLAENPNIVSAEEELEFFWIQPDEFEKLNFLPTPLRDLMKDWAAGDKRTWWGSNMVGWCGKLD